MERLEVRVNEKDAKIWNYPVPLRLLLFSDLL